MAMRPLAFLLLFLGTLLVGCAHHQIQLDPPATQKEAFLLEHLPAPAPTENDEAWARNALDYLARSAGRGLEDSVDISAACGCVEGGDSGGGGGGGSGGGPIQPDIEGPYKAARIRIKVALPEN